MADAKGKRAGEKKHKHWTRFVSETPSMRKASHAEKGHRLLDINGRNGRSGHDSPH
jgi:hypothetical protein